MIAAAFTANVRHVREVDSDHDLLHCIYGHLRTFHSVEPGFPETQKVKNCEEKLKAFVDETISKQNNGFLDANSKPISEGTKKCIIEKSVAMKYPELAYMNKIYESATHLSQEQKDGWMKKIFLDLQKIRIVAILNCSGKENFESVLKQKYVCPLKSENEVEKEKFCIKKLVVDNKYFGGFDYAIEMNPKNIAISEISCEPIIQSLRNRFVDENLTMARSELEAKCISYANNEHHFFEYSMRLYVFNELNYTDEQKEDEYRAFLETYPIFLFNIIKCTKSWIVLPSEFKAWDVTLRLSA